MTNESETEDEETRLLPENKSPEVIKEVADYNLSLRREYISDFFIITAIEHFYFVY